MKVGMNLLLWTAAASEEHLKLIGDIRAWGYDSVEFPMFAADASPWSRLARALDDLGLHRTAVTVVQPEANPISSDAAVRRAGVDHLKRCIDSCAALGADGLSGPIYSPCGALTGRGRTDDEWQWGVEAVREAAAHAAPAGVVLGVEPLNRFETYFLNCQDDAARFVREVGHPSVGILFDTFHANIEEKDPVAAIERTGPLITQFHVSENDRSTPGEGHVPWPATFAALKRVGYDGTLTVEAFGRALPEIAAATCIWRETFASETHLARSACRFIRESWASA
ncbi:MAG TPA: sugar phosphate isomerase/epimerase [Chthonomonadales bacterium]|nr:sugar phosphate isomerase/epimerase [Chthonomonadales bacterium]